MQSVMAQQGRFWRYNYQILAGTGYWVIVAPIAASQVVTLWMFALASGFGQLSATRIAELMTPIIGAFFVAHSLAPEYRSGVGSVLASKPVSLSRVLTMRVSVGILAALVLTLVTLSICSTGLSPIDVWTPMLACLPSVWFYSMLGLLFATIFRNPLGGFAITLVLWGLDFAMGYGVHPLLSIQGLTGKLDADPLAHFWLAGKGTQLAVGTALWLVHSKLLARVCRPPERRDVLKIATVCAAVVVAYCVSGAGTVVGYAYFQRGNLPARDVIWLRRALQVYGPLPVAPMFGPAFVAYVSEPQVGTDPNALKSLRREQLERALIRWPNSIWADSIAFTLATESESVDPTAAVVQYMAVTDRHPNSPFAPRALANVARSDNQATDAERLMAGRRLISDYPGRREAETGAEALERNYPAHVKAEELAAGMQVASRVAPVHRRPDWLLRTAEMEAVMGRNADALRHAGEAVAEAQRLVAVGRSSAPEAMEVAPHTGRLSGVVARGEALKKRLAGGR